MDEKELGEHLIQWLRANPFLPETLKLDYIYRASDGQKEIRLKKSTNRVLFLTVDKYGEEDYIEYRVDDKEYGSIYYEDLEQALSYFNLLQK